MCSWSDFHSEGGDMLPSAKATELVLHGSVWCVSADPKEASCRLQVAPQNGPLERDFAGLHLIFSEQVDL